VSAAQQNKGFTGGCVNIAQFCRLSGPSASSPCKRLELATGKLGTDLKQRVNDAPPVPSLYCGCNHRDILLAAALTAADAKAAEEARALEAQTERRAARRAEQQRRVKELARKAAADLGRGGWKESKTEDSTNFAREFKLGVAKKARHSTCVALRLKLEMGRAGISC